MAEIEELLQRRTDLSTFVVHFTRDYEDLSARIRLLLILMDGRIRAGRVMGMAAAQATQQKQSHAAFYESQQVVCFTETPLEHAWMMCSTIEARQMSFAPYGLAFTRSWARTQRVNPVWYLDITPGHDWLTNPINRMVDAAIAAGEFAHDIFKLTPFIEQMGKTGAARKEFWWEREWRLAGRDLYFTPAKIVAVLVPAEDHSDFRTHLVQLAEFSGIADQYFSRLRFIDPRWSLERIIAGLAGVEDDLARPWPS